VQAAFSVHYRTVDELVVGLTHDLSKGGVFLKTDRFLPLNAVVRLHIELPEGGGDIPVICRVIYVRDPQAAQATGGPPGMGIQFLDMDADKQGRIQQFIAERRAGVTTEETQVLPDRGRRVLDVVVVDDDVGYRGQAGDIFRRRGDRVRVGADGLEALTLCLKQPPDVIVSDVQMPRMDGWQLLRVIRSRPSLSSVPVIFLTSLSGDSERLLGYQLGVDDYLHKPYREEELIARVERLVLRVHTRGPEIQRKTLRGDLEQVSLPSLLAFLEMEKKTGVLFIVGERAARLYLHEGRPLRVEIDPALGAVQLEMMLQLLDWSAGQFEFAIQDVACQDELKTSLTGLLLEHARRRDEAAQ
jgi:uncharacterized protein (TIGR02266 family)